MLSLHSILWLSFLLISVHSKVGQESKRTFEKSKIQSAALGVTVGKSSEKPAFGVVNQPRTYWANKYESFKRLFSPELLFSVHISNRCNVFITSIF